MRLKRFAAIGVLSVAWLVLAACSSSNNNGGSVATKAATRGAATTAAAAAPQGSASAAAPATTAGGTVAPATTAANTKIRRGGTMTIGTGVDAKIFDPMITSDVYGGYLLDQVFEGLTKTDANLKQVPWLADSWDISPDGKTYTFHLHKGIKFHDGT
ncbi:MAG: ABC transporter substrate-binding protein, partial [Dehalococcoidia bacterium]